MNWLEDGNPFKFCNCISLKKKWDVCRCDLKPDLVKIPATET